MHVRARVGAIHTSIVIAARRTFIAHFVNCATGRPLRSAPDAVQPQCAAVVRDVSFDQTTGAGGTERGGAPNAAAALGCRGAPPGAQA